MTTPSRRYLCLLTSKLKTKPAIQLFAIAVLALLASIGISQQPSVMLASGGGGGGGHDGGGGDRKDLASLKTVAGPRPPNIASDIKDETPAIQLGKALFWDQQVGSDGQTCAWCHFHAR